MSGKLAIIGAGSSGVTATKTFLEAGFTDITCFERRDVLGGLWHFIEREGLWEDESSVNRSTVINTSKEFMAFSDYPMPDWYPNFCHNLDVEVYFKDYAEHFGVTKHIRYNTEIMSLKKHSSFDSTGRWELRCKDHKSGEEKNEVFDFVLVCNGHHGAPHRPSFPGLDTFKGQVMHSKEFKDVRGHEGKNALVVGIGNSGGDCAVELSKYSKVYLSTRRGAWVLNRLTANGMPWDVDYHCRRRAMIAPWLPVSYKHKKIKQQLTERFDHDFYGMTPDHPPGSTHPTVNDELPNRIAAGMIKVKSNVRSFSEKGVTFDDGTYHDVELVVLCTGYKIEYPFIDKSILDIKRNRITMYKNMFLPDLKHQTIAFLAVIQPLGSVFPIAEMQSRVAARVFKGELKLPSASEMKREIDDAYKAMRKRYVDTARHTIQVDWLPFMDELAEMVGCKPNLLKYLFTDPRLFWALFNGPGVPYQYRLEGPDAWPGARHAILTTMDRVRKPFQTRKVEKSSSSSSGFSSLVFVATLLAGAATYAYYYIKRNNVELPDFLKAIDFLKLGN
ncbi:flavin-containing monooxygenase 5 [Aplysia californica]|uniref:Flavin-containing monooxygenase n=1 Tax=Aplysia californica TaxID=6500 RepID=A0ABM1W364_APLCA|nr:flavin-containing monooxygenase 5 [Aplysia californica]